MSNKFRPITFLQTYLLSLSAHRKITKNSLIPNQFADGIILLALSRHSVWIFKKRSRNGHARYANMETAPSVSCLPHNAKMSKAKKVLEESREIKNPELDLFDKGVSTFEEMPGLRKFRFNRIKILLLPNLVCCLAI